jgi:hypothetical protein
VVSAAEVMPCYLDEMCSPELFSLLLLLAVLIPGYSCQIQAPRSSTQDVARVFAVAVCCRECSGLL